MSELEKLLVELSEKADAATPGPWEVRYRELNNRERPKVWAENYGWLITEGELPKDYHHPSMDFIARCDPPTIKKLIAVIRRQKDLVEFIKTFSCDMHECRSCNAKSCLEDCEKIVKGEEK